MIGSFFMKDIYEEVKNNYNEYQQNIVYYPIEFDEYPVYYFEYLQKTFINRKLHYHHGFEIGVCVEGEGIFIIDNKIHRFTKNSVVFIPSAIPHIAQSLDEAPSKWKYLTIDWEKILGYKEIRVCENMLQSEDMALLVQLICKEVEKKEESYQNVATHLIKALIHQLLRCETVDSSPRQTDDDNDKVYAAICFISNNYNQKFTIEDLAAANNYSVNYFRKIFKKYTGLTPLDYIINFRLRVASTLLRTTNKSVLEIAEESGFPTLSSFNRYFKKKFSTTPSQWRKM